MARCPSSGLSTATIRSPRGPPILASASSIRPSAHLRLRDHHGPVGLLDLPAAEGAGQPGGGLGGAAEDQHARGVAVEPMHQAGALLGLELQGVQHGVEVAQDARAPLHRQPMRLVEHHDAVIAIDDHALQLLGILRGDREAAGHGLRPVRQRRDADLLPLLQPCIGLGPLAIHADLAGAQHLLQRALGELGEVAAEPAVEPGIRVGGDDGAVGNAHDAGSLTTSGRPLRNMALRGAAQAGSRGRGPQGEPSAPPGVSAP